MDFQGLKPDHDIDSVFTDSRGWGIKYIKPAFGPNAGKFICTTAGRAKFTEFSQVSDLPVGSRIRDYDNNNKEFIFNGTTPWVEAAASSSTNYPPAGGIPKTDLTSALQTSIDKADTAYQKAGSGIPKTDLEASVQASLEKADGAYVKPGGGIPDSDIAAWPSIDITSNVTLTSQNIQNYRAKIWIFTGEFTITIAELGLKLKALFKPPATGSAIIQPDMSNSGLALSLNINGLFGSTARSANDGRVFSIIYLKEDEYEINSGAANLTALENQVSTISNQYVKTVNTPTLETGNILRIPVVNQQGDVVNKDVDLSSIAGAGGSSYPPAGGIPNTDLAPPIQNLLQLAGTAYQKPGTGIPAVELENSAQISLGKADTAYQKPGTGIPKADLATTVQTSLDKADTALQDASAFATLSQGTKADTAYQKPVSGIPKTDLITTVQTSLDKADSAYQKPGTGVPKTDLSSAVQTSLDKADTALQTASFINAANITKINDYSTNGLTNISGNRMLVIGASTEKGFSAGGNVTSYARNNGTVTFVLNSPNTTPMVGQKCYLSHDSDGSISLFGEILTVSKSGNDYTMTMTDTRANIASKSNVQFIWFGIASNHSTVMQLLNAATGGILDVYNFATASTNTTEWNNIDRFNEIKKYGPYDYGYFGLGIGNDIQNVGQGSASAIVARVFTAMDMYTRIVRRGVLVSPLGTSSATITPGTASFTTMSLVESILAREIPIRYPNFEYISPYRAAMDLVNYGSADTTEMTNGRPPGELFETNAFIHYTPLGSEIIFKEVVPFIRRLFPVHMRQASRCLPDNIFDNTIADPGGTDFNLNGIKPWFGNVATAIVNVTGVGAIGSAPVGTTITATNLKAGMTAAISVENHVLGGRKTVLNFNDPVGFTTAPTVTWRYTGNTGATILDMLNSPKFQNQLCDLWVDFAFFGFNPGALKFIDISLIGVTSGGTTIICSPLSNLENDMGTASGRVWERGFSGSPLRTPGGFKIPAGTYTAGYIQIFFGGVNSTPLGSLTIEIANLRLTRRMSV